MFGEEALVQGGLERLVTGMAEKVMQVPREGSALDHFFGEVARV